MVKRKLTDDMQRPSIKKKKVSVSSCEEIGKIDLTSPAKLVESFLGEIKLKNFFDNYWEKKPLVINRKEPSFYGSLFSLATLREVLENNELLYEADLNVCKYKEGEKELLNENGRLNAKDVDNLLNKKLAMIQFYHPQRYVDDFWNMLEKLEIFFGSLVGSSVYVTPANVQGFPPHCDDAETFVLQLEGKAEWKLYKSMVELTRDYTQDLLEEDIGEPIMEVSLEPGDLLYFPRGVIHQSKTIGDGHSTCISISTYRENAWGDFMNHAVTQAVENALEHDKSIRSGLPIDYLTMMGTGKNISQYIEEEGESSEKDKKKYSNLHHGKVKEFKKALEKHVSKLVEHIDVNTATDAMCTHFMANRLPPYGYQQKVDGDKEKIVQPKINDKIKLRYPEHLRLEYAEEEEEDSDEDDDDDEDGPEDEEMDEVEEPSTKTKGNKSKKSGSSKRGKKAEKSPDKTDEEDDEDEDEAEVDDEGPHIKIVHTLENNRFVHMGPESFDEPGYIKLDISFAKAMVELLNCNDFIAVKDIMLDEDDEKILLVSTLLESDLVEIKSK